MNVRIHTLILALFALCVFFPASQSFGAKGTKPAKTATKSTAVKAGERNKESDDVKFKLKPGARQKVCLTCHPDFEETLKRAFVHQPVNKPGCPACHSPHTSRFPKQLSAEVSKICVTCHGSILPANARSTHKVALEGKCVQCHDPHAADNKFNLTRSGNEVCYACHKEKMDGIKAGKFKHNPVEKGCVNCHNPHASTNAAMLLKSPVPDLCKSCHKTDTPAFAKIHSNYPVANSNCALCHSVHGSNKAGLIYDTAHQPFANKQCNLCHESATSPNPLALKKKGFELCRGCHNTMINETFSKMRLHWPVVGKDGCLNCHSPHASPQKGLLKKDPIKVCGACHIDTIQRQERSVTKHQPMQDGMCTACHSPHASDNVLLFTQPSPIDVCGTCHDYHKHATHPIGDKLADKRNKNISMSCLSCHRAHGTEYKHMFPFATITELCTQCHVEYKR